MKVLFIGNSHTYFNDMPATYARLCAPAHRAAPEVTMLAYSGRTLGWHKKEYFSERFNILYGGYDFCVIQQLAHSYPGGEQTLEDGRLFIDLCNSVGTIPIVLETWARRDKPEEQQEMIDGARYVCEQTGAVLAPVGEIWQLLRETHPEIDLYWQDGAHASPLGDYLIAVVLAALTFGDEPMSLPTCGRDFTKGAPIDFENPKVIEQPGACITELDEAACAAIREAAEKVLSELRKGE